MHLIPTPQSDTTEGGYTSVAIDQDKKPVLPLRSIMSASELRHFLRLRDKENASSIADVKIEAKPRDGLHKGLKWGGKLWNGGVKKNKEGKEMMREEWRNKNEGLSVTIGHRWLPEVAVRHEGRRGKEKIEEMKNPERERTSFFFGSHEGHFHHF
ncbi:hypothetical protein MRB53_032653 [Persea americana]|uniref:Uncharacterized protein n=1 Tax=Persea americana TaxID=3435 RepID=A0ACC2KSP6_PERAE|nr:hypothetical protein MRB53_032653 [Persea americana]